MAPPPQSHNGRAGDWFLINRNKDKE